MSKSIEIERKFMVKRLPDDLESYAKKRIQQGYIFVGGEHEEARLRRTGDKYYLTIKRGTGLVRSEHEVELTSEQFEVLWPATLGRRLEKTRFVLPGNIELDIYHGDLDGLMTVEVEFKTVEESDNFVPPEWFSEELTDDPKYKNQFLVVRGIPA